MDNNKRILFLAYGKKISSPLTVKLIHDYLLLWGVAEDFGHESIPIGNQTHLVVYWATIAWINYSLQSVDHKFIEIEGAPCFDDHARDTYVQN